MTEPAIVWFRNDLRFHDNSALAAAIRRGGAVIPVFVWSPDDAGDWSPGGAGKWWLHRALEDFTRQWESRGGRFIIRSGNSEQVISGIASETGATAVYWNRRYEAPLRELDSRIKRGLADGGIEVKSFSSSLVVEPHTVGTKDGSPYKVFTPFWKAVKDREAGAPDDPDLGNLVFPGTWPDSDPLESLSLLPRESWHEKLARHWRPGEDEGRRLLDQFMEGPVDQYKDERDFPGIEGTSRLSPYLHWGHIGPREIVHRLQRESDLDKPGPLTFLKEVYWREFAYHVLYHFPHTADEPLRPEFSQFPWQEDRDDFRRWRKGLTGFPIVDAGMRQLWETGWMHNRVRMIVASLLVKQMLQHWKAGARWFWDTLVDADLASNTLGWQWSGGCGADAAPYFRVFNPVLQGRKFDPDGTFVRRFVPELSGLPDEHIHSPWDAPPEVLSKAGVRLGDHYPEPVIDLKTGRDRALKAFERFKNSS